ncbi:MAG: peroxide stress protein YaaA [Bacteroidota bacterium]
MLFVISPAKTLDYEVTTPEQHTMPRLLHQSKKLVSILKKKSAKGLAELMDISEPLAIENERRYKSYDPAFQDNIAKQALMVFKGHVYQGLQAEDFDAEDVKYAQQHLRILSGLYGLLRPLDLMQPYRLEMGTKLETSKGKNLYAFWDDEITKLLNEDLQSLEQETVINLASKEYFKAVKPKQLQGKVIHIDFKELRGDKYKIISFFAKVARGQMCRFAIKNKVHQAEELKQFQEDNYVFNPDLSDETNWVFTR